MAFDLIVRNAVLPGKDGIWQLAIAGGRIAAVEREISAEAGRIIDAQGFVVTPPFVDSHFHMDATLSLGLPRLNQSGTLLEGNTADSDAVMTALVASGVPANVVPTLVCALQNAHDSGYTPELMQGRLRNVAAYYGLTVPS